MLAIFFFFFSNEYWDNCALQLIWQKESTFDLIHFFFYIFGMGYFSSIKSFWLLQSLKKTTKHLEIALQNLPQEKKVRKPLEKFHRTFSINTFFLLINGVRFYFGMWGQRKLKGVLSNLIGKWSKLKKKKVSYKKFNWPRI